MRLTGGVVRAAGTSSFAGWAIDGTGTFLSDPTVSVVGPIASGVNVVVAEQGHCSVSGGALGTPANATLRGPAGMLGALFLGSVGTAMSVPGFQFDLWLAPGTFAPGAVGVFGAPLTASVLVPTNPLLLGTQFGWQGVTFDPTAGFAFSTPALFVP